MRSAALDGTLKACIHALIVVNVALYAWNKGYDGAYGRQQFEAMIRKCTVINVKN